MIHLHAIVDAIALLGRHFQPSQRVLRRARSTKIDRFFRFDELQLNGTTQDVGSAVGVQQFLEAIPCVVHGLIRDTESLRDLFKLKS